MAIAFEMNQPQTLSFPYGDFRQIDGRYGRKYMYTVDGDTGRDRLFADPGLHAALQAAGMQPGRRLQITKLIGEGEEWAAAEDAAAEQAGPPDPTGPVAAGPPIKAPAKKKKAARPDYAAVESLMGHCLRSAADAWRDLEGLQAHTSEDVRAVGITLFLECARKGIAPAPRETPAPGDHPAQEAA